MRGPWKITSKVHSRAVAQTRPKVMEELERRRLLSVSFAAGIVRVIGTAGNDAITVDADGGGGALWFKSTGLFDDLTRPRCRWF